VGASCATASHANPFNPAQQRLQERHRRQSQSLVSRNRHGDCRADERLRHPPSRPHHNCILSGTYLLLLINRLTNRDAMRLWSLLLLLCLAACAGRTAPPTPGYATSGAVECVPFARNLSGINLAGDAYSWWAAAAGRYPRSQSPEPGAVLVFRRTSRLPQGHVSVVSAVLSDRQILVTQANWVHGRITRDQPVMDISPAHDWTLVRVWWEPAGLLGVTAYPTDGFILPGPRRNIARAD
jgi:hypothetical protein